MAARVNSQSTVQEEQQGPMTGARLSVADRILQLLQHLGVERAHVAGSLPGDWQGLVANSADRVASLALICPTGLDPKAVSAVASRVLVIHGDRGPIAERVRTAVERIPEARLVILTDYPGIPLADFAAERGDEIGPPLLDFLQRMEGRYPRAASTLASGIGEVAGISYRVEGSGPPLILLPLALARSQWEPLLSRLSQRFSTIVLGGPHLGHLPLLEARPGGRVGAIVRGDDWPALLTLPLRAEVQGKAAQALGAGAVERGCADASLYRRFHAAGLIRVRKFPQLAVYDDSRSVIMAQGYQPRILSALTPSEGDEWQAAVTQAEAHGDFVLALLHHCAIGTKP